MTDSCYDAETQKAVKAMVETPDKTEHFSGLSFKIDEKHIGRQIQKEIRRKKDSV